MHRIVEKLIRKEVHNFVPYMPGKPIAEVQREFGITDVHKLASNENAYGPSKRMIEKLKTALDTIHRYPESGCYDLRVALAQRFTIPKDQLVFGNGSDEIIELLGKTFLNKNDAIIVSQHAFVRYAMAGYLMGATVIDVHMRNDLTMDVERIVRAVTKKTKIIFLGNPNNPTGTYITKKEFELLMRRVPRTVLVAMDEAYYEFVDAPDYPQTIPYLKRYPNLVVLRTFSKLFGIAGLRAGYMIAHPAVVAAVERVRPPFNVNILAQIAAIEAMKDVGHRAATKRMVHNGKKYLYAVFKKLGVSYIPSATNFILFKVPHIPGKQLFTLLLKHGVIIRAVDEYGLPDYARVTIGTPRENKAFVTALKSLKI